MISMKVNGRQVQVADGVTVAVALLQAGAHRESVTGAPREAACGMGTCWYCFTWHGLREINIKAAGYLAITRCCGRLSENPTKQTKVCRA